MAALFLLLIPVAIVLANLVIWGGLMYLAYFLVKKLILVAKGA